MAIAATRILSRTKALTLDNIYGKNPFDTIKQLNAPLLSVLGGLRSVRKSLEGLKSAVDNVKSLAAGLKGLKGLKDFLKRSLKDALYDALGINLFKQTLKDIKSEILAIGDLLGINTSKVIDRLEGMSSDAQNTVALDLSYVLTGSYETPIIGEDPNTGTSSGGDGTPGGLTDGGADGSTTGGSTGGTTGGGSTGGGSTGSGTDGGTSGSTGGSTGGGSTSGSTGGGSTGGSTGSGTEGGTGIDTSNNNGTCKLPGFGLSTILLDKLGLTGADSPVIIPPFKNPPTIHTPTPTPVRPTPVANPTDIIVNIAIIMVITNNYAPLGNLPASVQVLVAEVLVAIGLDLGNPQAILAGVQYGDLPQLLEQMEHLVDVLLATTEAIKDAVDALNAGLAISQSPIISLSPNTYDDLLTTLPVIISVKPLPLSEVVQAILVMAIKLPAMTRTVYYRSNFAHTYVPISVSV